MEILGLVIVVAGLAMYYGLFDSIERGARMADRRIADLERDQKEELIKKNATRSVDAEQVAKAKTNITLIDEIDL